MKLDSIAGKATKESPLSDADKAELQTSFDQAIKSAQMATAYDSLNYLNFRLLGSVYQAAGALGVKDVYVKAIEAYQTASGLNPLNPGIKLAMASASFSNGKIKEAKDYAQAALSLKPNYIDAMITLSQIGKSEGNTSEAFSYAQNALALDPTNKNLIEYVDSLKNATPAASPTPSNKSKE